MYDVVKKIATGNYYKFYCVTDLKESQLIMNFKKHFDDNKEKTNRITQDPLSLPLAPAVMKDGESVKRDDIVLSLNNQFSHNYKSIWLDKFTPPPRT